MKEKLIPTAQKSLGEKWHQEPQSKAKKPFQEPILTRHETLVQNTHISATGVTAAIGPIGGGP